MRPTNQGGGERKDSNDDSAESMHFVLKEKLGQSKTCTHWVPKALHPYTKNLRTDYSVKF